MYFTRKFFFPPTSPCHNRNLYKELVLTLLGLATFFSARSTLVKTNIVLLPWGSIWLTKSVTMLRSASTDPSEKKIEKWHCRASMAAQWLRIHLSVQGTQVQALVREDPTCRRATKPVCHKYWAYALEPASHNYWAHVSQLLKPAGLEPMLCNKRSHRIEKPAHRNEE